MSKHALLPVGAVLLLAGCTLIPKYNRPAAPVAGVFPGGPTHSDNASEIRWRDFFTDPRLKRLVEIALANNRDLRVAALTVERYQAEYRIQRAAGGNTSLELSHLFNHAAAVWSFAPQISVPIFNGGSNVATINSAEVSKRIEIANYEETIQTAFREVAAALVGRRRYAQQVNAQEALVAAEQQRYDLSNLRYRQGEDSYLTVLTAQQDLYSAQNTLISTRANGLANLITLYEALGGGWR